MHGAISPDGRYVAYLTLATGEQRIAVRPIEGTAYWVVADVNSNRPRWSPDGRFIYFSSPGQGIFRIAISMEGGFRTIGEPERVATTYGDADFDVAPDGGSLVIAGAGVSREGSGQSGATIGWWQNWVQSLPEDSDL